MKKFLFAMMALVFAAVSCQQEGTNINYDGDDAVAITLTVDAPELGATRVATGMDSAKGAIDNFDADEWAAYDVRYMLEIYDVTAGYENLTTPVKTRMVQTLPEYAPTTFEFRLVPDRKYKFVVWADFVAEGTDTDLFYNTTDLKNITYTAANAMNECMDAYFVEKDLYINNSLTNTLTLTRPFGKVRVITTDITDVNIGTTPAQVNVKLYNHPTFVSFNAITGQTETTTEEVTYSYTVAKDAPYTLGYDSTEKNQTLFTAYIFADREDAQEINFTMEVAEADGRVIRYHDFNTQIPLRRNYLTTIIGNLLTTSTEFRIIIDDNFVNDETDEDWIVENKEPLATPQATASVSDLKNVAISWEPVDGAINYTVTINDVAHECQALTYSFEGKYDTTYNYSVVANAAANTDFRASEPFVGSITTEADPYIYLKPNNNWKSDNARFAIYVWNDNTGTNQWFDMVDSDKDGIYEVLKPNGFQSIIFCRMNPSSTANTWNNNWNQTSDLTFQANGNNLYTISEGAWSNGAGTWSKK